MQAKENGVAPAADDGLAKLLQNAKVSATVKSPAAQAKVSENKDNGNLKDLLTKEGVLPAPPQQMPRPMIAPPPRGIAPPVLNPRGIPGMMMPYDAV